LLVRTSTKTPRPSRRALRRNGSIASRPRYGLTVRASASHTGRRAPPSATPSNAASAYASAVAAMSLRLPSRMVSRPQRRARRRASARRSAKWSIKERGEARGSIFPRRVRRRLGRRRAQLAQLVRQILGEVDALEEQEGETGVDDVVGASSPGTIGALVRYQHL